MDKNNSGLGVLCGSKIRKNVSVINTQKQVISFCPKCKNGKLRRTSIGIWECKKCNYQKSGGAYTLNV